MTLRPGKMLEGDSLSTASRQPTSLRYTDLSLLETALDEKNDTLQLSVSISTDRDGFMRRTCSSCGRDFKTEVDPADLQWLLNSYCGRNEPDPGEKNADAGLSGRIWCPYCGHRDGSAQMHTEETVAYLKQIVYREYIAPQMAKLFSGLDNSVGSKGRSGGLFSVSIEVTHNKSILPVRPIHGPEPADFKIIHFLCCNRKIKVSDHWTDVCLCSLCGTEVALI